MGEESATGISAKPDVTPAIELNRVSKQYDGVKAVDQLSLAVAPDASSVCWAPTEPARPAPSA